jgi:hypothetical protein
MAEVTKKVTAWDGEKMGEVLPSYYKLVDSRGLSFYCDDRGD